MRTHILTLNWNGAKYLKPLYDSMGNLDPYSNTWIIRDNGSKDNSKEIVEGFDGRLPVRFLEVGHNRDSFAKCTNWLFEQAEPSDEDLVLLLNNDVVFPTKMFSIDKMKQLLQKTGAAVVGVRLLYMGTDKLQHAGVIFGERYNKMPYHYRPGEKSDANSKKNRYFQAVTAAVCLVKASSFKRVGGMDEAYRWAFEDVDLCLQIGREEKIAYCGEAFAYHEESASLKKNPVNKMFMGKNAQYFKEKWLGKYEIDHDRYLKDARYNEIKV